MIAIHPWTLRNQLKRSPHDIIIDQDEEAVGQLQDEVKRLRAELEVAAGDCICRRDPACHVHGSCP